MERRALTSQRGGGGGGGGRGGGMVNPRQSQAVWSRGQRSARK